MQKETLFQLARVWENATAAMNAVYYSFFSVVWSSRPVNCFGNPS